MWRIPLYLVYLTTCSSSPSSQPVSSQPVSTASAENTEVVNPASPSSSAVLGARAEQVLQSDAPSRFDLPDENDPPRRHKASQALDAACRAGHRRSCWYLFYIATDDDALAAAFRSVVHDCQNGDFWSCRSLPRARLSQVPTGLPGEQGRDRCRGYDTMEKCTHALMIECQGGFPYSCEVLAAKISNVKEREELILRAGELSREGCAHGIIGDCETVKLEWPERDRRVAYEQLCKIRRSECDRLGAMLEDDGRIEAARLEYERSCQYQLLRPQNCLELGRRYLAGELPEPVPGRGHKLLDIACAKLEPAERDHEPGCKTARK